MMRLLPSLLLLAALTACGSSVDPDYYTLAPTDGAIQAVPPLRAEIHRPSIAGYLDRPEMVNESGFVQSRDGGRLWGEPLDAMIGRILALDVTQRLPDSVIFTQAGNFPKDGIYSVDVDIQQFDGDKQGHSLLVAQIMIRSPDGGLLRSVPAIRLTGEAAKPGTSMARVMSGLVGQLADRIAGELHDAALKPSLPAPPA